MNRELTFTARMEPTSWQRVARNGGQTYTPKKTVDAKLAIRAAYLRSYARLKPHTGPVEMDVVSTFAVPMSWPKWKRALAIAGLWPCTNPKDVDNLAKCALDALNAVAYLDDRQVVALCTSKQYGDVPRVVVTLRLRDEPVRP